MLIALKIKLAMVAGIFSAPIMLQSLTPAAVVNRADFVDLAPAGSAIAQRASSRRPPALSKLHGRRQRLRQICGS